MNSFNISRRTFLIGSLYVSAGLSCSTKQAFQAGIGEQVITPDWPLPMRGYGGRTENSKGVHDDIYARAFIFDAGERFILITLDLIGIEYTVYKEITKRIAGRMDIVPEAIAINFSHTHAGPRVTDKYKPFLIDRIVQSAELAEQI